MIKILKKIVKSNSNYDKKYVVIYKNSTLDFNYNFMYCSEKDLKQLLTNNRLFNYHIFLAKDEIKIETEFETEVE